MSRSFPEPSKGALSTQDRTEWAAPETARAEVHPVVFAGNTGWLHVPAPDGEALLRDVGLVFCSPLGREARSAHLPMRRLADLIAAAGFPS